MYEIYQAFYISSLTIRRFVGTVWYNRNYLLCDILYNGTRTFFKHILNALSNMQLIVSLR